jgi:hypothetical protein
LSPDARQHRGPHPRDAQLFAPDNIPRLRSATSELSWLLGRGYAIKSALKLVGDQYNLTERQRLAVSRAACSDERQKLRSEHCLALDGIENEELVIDGFNLIITLEAALGGGLLITCRDECLRDLSSVHGSYRSVLETERAILLIGEALETLKPKSAKWFLDRPISNSGRLAQRIKELARERGWPWSLEVVFNPDASILATEGIAVTSDSLILDGAKRWINLSDFLVRRYLPQAWVIDLSS